MRAPRRLTQVASEFVISDATAGTHVAHADEARPSQCLA
jgi:hypothetical protein